MEDQSAYIVIILWLGILETTAAEYRSPADRKNPAFLLFGRNKSVLLGRIFQLKLQSAVELRRRGNTACAEKGKTRDNFSPLEAVLTREEDMS